MQFTVQSSGVPVGNYRATFDGIEAQQANAEKGYGPGIRFKWRITEGPFAGQIASRVTGTSPTPTNACGKAIASILGRAIAPGENVNLQAHIGRAYLIVVEQSQNGGTRVGSAIPI